MAAFRVSISVLLATVCSCVSILTTTSSGQDVQAATVVAATNPRIVEHPEDQYVVRTEPATLNCKAEGEPPPVITWYRDGQPVVTANENPSSHRMLLPSGQLFFLKVIHNKNSRPDVGTYYCNATNPETRISVISRPAKLEIAVLREEFREQPQNVEAVLGTTTTINCRAPSGQPEPKIRWIKDGERLRTTSDRIVVTETGTLQIRDLRRDDSGSYLCVAFNIAGERESVAAQLNVREKPLILQGPKDVVVSENQDIIFQCQATGDPEPVIIWKKQEGQIPAERSQILGDRSLRIENAQVGDEGLYVCRMENAFGNQEAEARLTVHSRPSFIITPRDKVVAVGRRLTIKCAVTGSPPPAVFWNKVNSQTFMFPNQNNGRFNVLEDGTLVIDSVRREDAGEYSCQALSMSGSAVANVRIDVKDSDTRPPPIIYHGPQNQTLPVGNPAMLPCLASGEPAPTIVWLKGNAALTTHDLRITVLESGTLEIKDLRLEDTGVYVCRAVSETGETSWSAGLIVESQLNHQVVFHRTPESSTFPGAPSKPTIADVTETSMRLSWKPNSNSGASPLLSYTVEYFSHDIGEGWVVASSTIVDPSFVVRNLRPGTSYMFLVRSQNSHGLSLPSPVSAVVKTRGDSSQSRPTVPPLDPQLVAEKLSSQVVLMHTPDVISSTAIRLSWEVRRNQQFIEGFHIRYRVVPELDGSGLDGAAPQQYARVGRVVSPGGASATVDYTVVTVQSSTATMYVLTDLQKFTYYEVRVQPFYRSVLGTESNLFRVRTLSDKPSSSPLNIQAVLLENETLSLTWNPPPKQHRNGPLLGYKIFITANEPKYSREVQVNTSIDSFMWRPLVKDITYRVEMLAFNDIGDGIRSDAIVVGRQPAEAKTPLINEPWFIATLISIVGAAVWIVVCLFSIWLCRRHKASKKGSKNRSLSVPVFKYEENIRYDRSGHSANQMPLLSTTGTCNGLTTVNPSATPYVNGNYRGNQPCVPPCCYDNESPSDVDSKANGSVIGHTYQTLESLQHAEAFLAARNGSAVAYATTTLVGGAPAWNGGANGVPVGGCIPNPQAYMIQPVGASSGDTLAMRRDGSEPRIESNGYQVGAQPKLFLPPPPDHSDQETLAVSECGKQAMDSSFGRLPAYIDYENGLRRMNCMDGRTYASTYSDAAPHLSDPRMMNFDPYSDCRVPQNEMPADLLADIAESDLADTMSESSSEGSFTADNFVDPVNCSVDLSPIHQVQNELEDKGHRAPRHRQRAHRPASPYSTDSNYSAATAAAAGASGQRPQYPPRSRRRKQNYTAAELENQSGSGGGRNQSPLANRLTTSTATKQVPNDDLVFSKPPAPYSTVNSSRSGNSAGGPTSSAGFRGAPTASSTIGGGNSLRFVPDGESTSSRQNPLTAFDTRDTPIV